MIQVATKDLSLMEMTGHLVIFPGRLDEMGCFNYKFRGCFFVHMSGVNLPLDLVKLVNGNLFHFIKGDWIIAVCEDRIPNEAKIALVIITIVCLIVMQT